MFRDGEVLDQAGRMAGALEAAFIELQELGLAAIARRGPIDYPAAFDRLNRAWDLHRELKSVLRVIDADLRARHIGIPPAPDAPRPPDVGADGWPRSLGRSE